MARKTPTKKQLRKQAKKAQATLAGREEAVRNLIENQDLHEDLRALAEAARTAYARVAGAGPAALLQDKRVHSELRNASDALLDAKKSLKGGKKAKQKKQGRGLLGFVVLGLGGAVAAVVAVPSVRSKALDVVFGPEEELDYGVGAAAPASSPNGSTQAAASATPGATA
ncbi:MAG: hypothetical protein M0P31_10035 [Solirubrobacteraceae bacterium]|nr:hypothetical protein [Solirubrobacteraceae bacterium]